MSVYFCKGLLLSDATFEGNVRRFTCIYHKIKLKVHMKTFKDICHSFDIFSQKLSFVPNLVLDSDGRGSRPQWEEGGH